MVLLFSPQENSGKNTMTAESYEEVADFVTRKAPFDVLEAAKPLDDGTLRPGRLALYLLISVDASVEPGSYLCVFTLRAGDASFVFPLTINVTACVIPPLKDARFGMVKGRDGHIVVRVAKGGDSYHVYTLTDSDRKMTVKTINGKYSSR